MDIKKIIKQYPYRLTFTLILILAEAFLGILFPLFIGKAIGGIINSDVSGIIQLGILGFFLIVIGGFRRMYDSRFYAKIYTKVCRETIGRMPKHDNSIKTARLNMLGEMVEFAENQLPNIIQHSVGLVGVMIIIAFLNLQIFVGTIIAGILIIGIYLLSSTKTFQYNSSFNNEMEAQVNVISTNKPSKLHFHLLKLMKWNIKLSDIETVNYSVSWIIMMFLLLASIGISVSSGIVEYGLLLALIMYVYQYIESMVSLPLYYQQWLRLKEIISRIQTI
jgi:ABC-type multidrug transport system fused ATPase/permease subunit